jgi:hypothetical protein
MSTEVNTKVIEEKTNDLVIQAKNLVVSNQDQYNNASDFLKTIKALQKEVVETFADAKKKAHEAHKAITAAETKHLNPLKIAESVSKKAITDYVQEEQRKARIAAQAEQERLRKIEEEKRIAEAEKAEKEGKIEEAEEIISQEVKTVFVQPIQTVEKVEGVSFSENWGFDIVDEKLIPREFLLIDEKKIRQIVKALKGSTNIPGVQVKCEKIARVR